MVIGIGTSLRAGILNEGEKFGNADRFRRMGFWGFKRPECSDKIGDELTQSAVTPDKPSPPNCRMHHTAPVLASSRDVPVHGSQSS